MVNDLQILDITRTTNMRDFLAGRFGGCIILRRLWRSRTSCTDSPANHNTSCGDGSKSLGHAPIRKRPSSDVVGPAASTVV